MSGLTSRKHRPYRRLSDEQVSAAINGFVGYNKDGRFVHYCHCGKWGSFGHNVSLRNGKLGTWYCREHRP